ncbi:hypothetical protein MTBLM5_30135 [Magnetospirillum sp. LM-5]|uniref:YajG family lipoprotein n=1 Tax=Magnetospirillum sp. LM-5 TaxID=2681466 RepID=UPI00137E11F6|nr:YajG family lipoprotein [Magnetospirillum sp. LM-5]CAA7619424.1 hypothetical protein MTBLM5_30135 [Magnetospirillum sp. LM-5]
MRAILLSILITLAVSGCVRTRTVEFTPPGPESRNGASWAQMVGVNISVIDKRTDKTNIGRAQAANSDLHRFVVQSTNNPQDAIKQRVEAELRARGVNRLDGPAYLLVDILKLDSATDISNFRVGVVAEAALSAMVMGADGATRHQKIYQRKETGQGEYWTLDTVEQGAYRLQKVVAGLIQEMIDDDRLIQALIAANRGTPS